VPAAGYPLRALKGRPLPRRFSPASIRALLTLAAAVPRATALLRDLAPSAVIGTGGYASACVLYAAARLRLPTLLIELNAVPGRTTRALARRVTRVCTQFEETATHLPGGRCELTGSPVRAPFLTVSRETARAQLAVGPEDFCVLVFGGSQAARTLNLAVEQVLPLLAAAGRPLCVRHLCGETFLPTAEGLAAQYAGHPSLAYRPEAYRDDLWTLLSAADVVVCRAGGSSLSELSVVGVPAILVPYPFATDDHQARNAASFRDRGAAVVVPDRELSGTRLVQELTALLDDPQRGETMRRQALSAGFPEAAEHLLSLVLALT